MFKTIHRLLTVFALAAGVLSASAADSARLEYIAWEGGASAPVPLLSTGVFPNNLSAVEVKFQSANVASERAIFCARGYNEDKSTDTLFNTFSCFSFNGKIRFDFGTTKGTAGGSVTTNDPHVVRLGYVPAADIVTGTYDGTNTLFSKSSNYVEINGPLCLFGGCRYRPGYSNPYYGIANGFIGRIYYCKIFDNQGNLIHHFLPFRNNAGTVGMIDIVNNLAREENKFVGPVQGTLLGGPEVCFHEYVVNHICQYCHKDVYDLKTDLTVGRATNTMSFAYSVGAFGFKGKGEGDADTVTATLEFAEYGLPFETKETHTLTNTGDFAFTDLTIDPEKTYQYRVTFMNNGLTNAAEQTPVTKVYEDSVFPPSPFTSDFLLGLSKLSYRIPASPYATGGDFILLENGDYVHVFCSTNGTKNFVASQTLMARVLAVGGGGAGGIAGGGGGGGGMVELETVAFLAGVTNTIQVGAGGVWPKEYADVDNKVVRDITKDDRAGHWGEASGKRFSGGASSISNSTDEVIFARGGGGGGSCGAKPGLDGGSGGGAFNGSVPGLGTDGQGYPGGSAALSQRGGSGGGGAGEIGGNAQTNANYNAGNGGNGRISNILGAGVYFAGGGGGGVVPSWAEGGTGGFGGGGSKTGDYSKDTAQSGTDGLGGGGAGSGGQPGNVWAFLPGDGGNGIVIIRYEKPREDLAISLTSIAPTNDATATVRWTLLGPGTSTISARMGLDGERFPISVPLATNAVAGSGSAVISGLLPGRTYYLSLLAEEEGGSHTASTTPVSFTVDENGAFPDTPLADAPAIASVLVKDRTGTNTVAVAGTLAQAGTGSAFADCTATFRWGTQNSYIQMTSSVQGRVQDDGTCELTATNLANIVYYGCLEVENAAGAQDRTFFSFTPVDTRTYSWNPEIPEGNWKDRNCWTTADGSPPWAVGYPTYGATADFTSTLCATVHVSGTVECKTFRKENAQATYVFVGDDDAATIAHSVYETNVLPENETLIFDRIRTDLLEANSFPYTLKNGTRLVLRNHSSVNVHRNNSTYRDGFILEGANASLEILDGSEFFSGAFSMRNGSMTIGGPAPKITIENNQNTGATFGASTTNGTIICMIPESGWQTAPFQPSRAQPFGAGESGKLIFSVPYTAPLWNAMEPNAMESTIISWKQGIDVSKIRFGKTMKRADYFYFTDETGAGYVFCTDGSGALAPLLEPDVPIEEPPLITKLMYHHRINYATILYMR